MSGASDVFNERMRQISDEGRTSEHDDAYADRELARAAVSYLLNYIGSYLVAPHPHWWPWDRLWWKPGPPRRDLVRAGALICAEIDRLDRMAAQK